MAKFSAVILWSVVVLLILEVTFSEGQTKRSRTRKVTSVRKKIKSTVATSTTTAPVETTVEPEPSQEQPERGEDIETTVVPEEPTTLPSPTVSSPLDDDQEEPTAVPKRNKFLKRNPSGSAFDCSAEGECDLDDCPIPDLSSCPTGLVTPAIEHMF